jgi:hypothetical protein
MRMMKTMMKSRRTSHLQHRREASQTTHHNQNLDEVEVVLPDDQQQHGHLNQYISLSYEKQMHCLRF